MFHASFSHQAQSWARPRRVVAKVEWHQGELYPRVGFLVTNLTRPAECLAAERCWDRARWAIEMYAWRFDGLERTRPARGAA